MNALAALFDPATTARLLATLAHSLWQAALVAVVVWLVLARLPARAASARYAACLVALLAVLVASATTWTLLATPPAAASASAPTGQLHPSIVATSLASPAASTTTPESADVPPPAEPATFSWQAALVVAWLVGVCLMLFRVARSLHATTTLSGNTAPPPDHVARLVDELRRQLGVARRVVVLAGDRLRVPGVVGVLWPTLLLPLAMISSLSVDELRAVVVHELVHIRRHDFAVNLLQRVIESLFFFNPAVWWISRRVRIEREACVDAATVAVTGQSVAYASLLVGVAERLAAAPVPALVAFADPAEENALLDRVQRVIEPSASPRVRLPWATLLVVLVGSAAIVAAIWQGTSAAVFFAKKLMTDQERVEAVAAVQKQLGPTSGNIPAGSGTIRGTIRTEDGRPLAGKVQIDAISRRTGPSTSDTCCVGVGRFRGDFSGSVRTGTVWLHAAAERYAPVWIGPFTVMPGAVVENVDIVLPLGFTATIHVTEPQGRPIKGAVARGRIRKLGCEMGGFAECMTDAQGTASVRHVTRGPYSMTVQCPGYQTLERELALSPDHATEIQLERAHPFIGRLVSIYGEPVTDAKIRLLAEQWILRGGTNCHGNSAPEIAQTNADGQFMLNQLNDEKHYVLLVESPTCGRAVLHDVAPGEVRSFTLGPRCTVRGEIVGPLKELYGKPPYVAIEQPVDYGFGHFIGGPLSEQVSVQVKDGVARFEYSNLLPGELTIWAGKHTAKASVSAKQPIATVRIDLASPLPVEKTPNLRKVVLRFVRDGQLVSLDGRVSVQSSSIITPGDTEPGPQYMPETVPIADGQAAAKVFAPGQLTCKPQALAGWFFREVSERIEPGDGPLTIDVPVLPAGAVRGQLSFPFEPWTDRNPQVLVTSRWDETNASGTTSHTATIDATIDMKGQYLASPVPLGAKCSVKLFVGHNVQVAPVFTLDASQPIHEVDLRLPPPVAAAVKVVDPQRRPVSGLPLSLHWEQSGASGHRWSDCSRTNSQGRATFSDVNAQTPQYYVEIAPRRDWQPTNVPLRVDGSVTEIKLTPGQRLDVTVLDSTTGHPVPNAEVFAMRYPSSTEFGAPNLFEAEARTDKLGRCRFSNLPDGRVILNVRDSVGPWTIGDEQALDPRESPETTLRVTMPPK